MKISIPRRIVVNQIRQSVAGGHRAFLKEKFPSLSSEEIEESIEAIWHEWIIAAFNRENRIAKRREEKEKNEKK